MMTSMRSDDDDDDSVVGGKKKEEPREDSISLRALVISRIHPSRSSTAMKESGSNSGDVMVNLVESEVSFEYWSLYICLNLYWFFAWNKHCTNTSLNKKK